MKKTLIVHIGEIKTGTSSIQNYFATHRLEILPYGVFYPTNINHNYLVGDVLSSHPAQSKGKFESISKNSVELPEMALLDLSRNDRLFRPNVGRLRHIFRISQPCFALLSAEIFSDRNPNRVQESIKRCFGEFFDEIHYILYVRPHVGYFKAKYTEHLKNGWIGSDQEEFVKNELKSFKKKSELIDAWMSQPIKCSVRPFIKKQWHNYRLIDDFKKVTELDFLPNWPEIIANESLSTQSLATIGKLQSLFNIENMWIRRAIGWEIQRIVSEKSHTKENFSFSKKSVKIISKHLLKDAEAVDKQLGLTDNGFASEIQSALIREHRNVELMRNQEFDTEVLAAIMEIVKDLITYPKFDWNEYFDAKQIPPLP